MAFTGVVLWVACGSNNKPTPEPSPPPSSAGPSAGPSAVVPTGGKATTPAATKAGSEPESIDEDTFAMEVVGARELPVGEPQRLQLKIQTKGPWHINQEYPLEVLLKSNHPEVVHVDTTPADRSTANYEGETQVWFPLVVTPKQSGSATIQVEVDFAVCTDENCVPEQRILQLTLGVK